MTTFIKDQFPITDDFESDDGESSSGEKPKAVVKET
jgi:hypothetical protein